MNPPRSAHDSVRTRLYPWIALASALVWANAARIPLIIHASKHLDSDLAIDGLVLQETTEGRLRWHYPGTPHVGIFAAFLSLPQAIVWGANPQTLVSGGSIAFSLTIVAIFLTARSLCGDSAAIWSLVPLAFGSPGVVWLSGRITGGHLLAVAWHAAAFFFTRQTLARGGSIRSFFLGVWCGLGFYNDRMFLLSLIGICAAATAAWIARGFSRSGAIAGLVFLLGFAIGDSPRELGDRIDPYDAYPGQFQTIFDRAALSEHARILTLDCIPRLVSGRDLRTFAEHPKIDEVQGVRLFDKTAPIDALDVAGACSCVLIFVFSCVSFLMESFRRRSDVSAVATIAGVTIASIAAAGAFLVNRNIFGSDNYRYLVFLIVPYAIGFGIIGSRLWRRGLWGRIVLGKACAIVLAAAFAIVSTLDLARWYDRMGMLNTSTQSGSIDEVLQVDWDHVRGGRGARWIYGGYWDVYRLSFLLGGRVRGVPFPFYPDRFGDRERLLAREGEGALLVRPSTREGSYFDRLAESKGKKPIVRSRRFLIYEWP